MRHIARPIESDITRRPAGRRSAARRASLALLAAATLVCLWCITNGRAFAPEPEFANAPATAQEGRDFSKFQHGSQRHASLGCADCHQRAGDNSVQPTYRGKVSLPGHAACQECHLPQFIQSNSPMCFICHTSVENNPNPPIKSFPGLLSFNAKFDHSQHNTGAARPTAGCAACHTPAGRRSGALTIPARLAAHAQCYTCHTPGAQSGGRDIASCATCHTLGGYTRTPASARAFAVGFNHQTHGRRQGLGCNDCHNLRAGAPQRRQVTVPQAAQHFGSARAQTCTTCHNGRRAFGDQDFGECVKCHKGNSFRL